MSICGNCGVELEDDMEHCPLCGISVHDSQSNNYTLVKQKDTRSSQARRENTLHQVLWQVISTVLFSGIVATLVIDLATNKSITWSVYPVAISLIIFSYVSLFAFWHTRKIYQLLTGLAIAVVILIVLDLLLPHLRWPARLGLPLLVIINLIGIVLMVTIDQVKHKGLNVIAYTCVAIALLCISIEGVISFYLGHFSLNWSIIVAGSLLPITAVLLFMHFRIKKNPDMDRIFHT